jgi:hypothetical protein
MLYRVLLACGVVLALSAGPSAAQNRFSIDLNVGAAIPTAELGGADLKEGFGVGFTGNVRVLPHLHVYGGWDYHRFVTKQLLAGSEFDIDDTGYAFGAKFQHPVMPKVDLWARGGGIYNHIEMEEPDGGDIVADSGHELGWEAGGGAAIMITESFSIMPGARYRTYAADLTVGQTTLPVDLSYVTAEVMFSWKFGGRPLSAIIR